MNRGIYWWVCLAALVVSACGAAIGAVRWLGPDGWVLALAPLERAPLFIGTGGALLIYLVTQSLPGGRAPIWLPRPPHDGWTNALSLAMLCATLAAWPSVRGGPSQILASTPLVLLAAFLFIDRMRRVQRQLVAAGFTQAS